MCQPCQTLMCFYARFQREKTEKLIFKIFEFVNMPAELKAAGFLIIRYCQ